MVDTAIERNLDTGLITITIKTPHGHSPLVARRHDGSGNLLKASPAYFRTRMYAALERIGLARHTPHDCRQTFSMLCEKYGVNENDRRRMLGHSFGSDVTNATYGHRTLDDLRAEIEKIKAP